MSTRKAKPKPKRQPRVITEQQKSFCRHFLTLGYNGTKAAVAAGYSKRNARFQASRLLTIANVQAHLTTRYRSELSSRRPICSAS